MNMGMKSALCCILLLVIARFGFWGAFPFVVRCFCCESEFLDNMIRGGHRKLARSFNLCYRYIDDLIVFNNKKFGDYMSKRFTPPN